MRNVHWLQALAIAIRIVGPGPSSRSAVKSTAYDNEMQELPTPTGRSTFTAELITDSASSVTNKIGRGNSSEGSTAARIPIPSAITPQTYTRAAKGRRITASPPPFRRHRRATLQTLPDN